MELFLGGKEQPSNAHHTDSGEGQRADDYRYMTASCAAAEIAGDKDAFSGKQCSPLGCRKKVLRSLRGDGSCEQQSFLG